MVYCNRWGGRSNVGGLGSLRLEAANYATLLVVMSLNLLLIGVSNGQRSTATPGCSVTDRDALLRFKGGTVLDSTTATPCDFSSWTVDEDCCGWVGVKCDASTGHVVELNLSSCALAGVIVPSSLGTVSGLEVLDLSNNTLHADVPEDLVQLQNLTFLSVAANGEPDGSVFNPGTFLNSSRFGTLTKLTHLDLGQSLTSFVGGDQYVTSQTFPGEICKLKNLTYLNLGGCNLVGSLPNCFASQMSALQFLDLSRNDLQDGNLGETTSMLEVFGNLTSLRTLTLDQVVLGADDDAASGRQVGESSFLSISALSRLRSLESLTLAGVNSLPKMKLRQVVDALQPLNATLLHLDLRDNNLTGVIPHSIQSFGNLRHLDLGNNLLKGNLTSSVFHLQLLQVLRLNRNQFSGVLPPGIGNLRRLQELNVTENSLDGAIPDEIGGCVNLTSLDLSNNRFKGSLPRSIGQLGSLRYLSLLKNANLGGDLPPEIGNLSRLEFLDFSHDAFTGTIPTTWGDGLPRLRFLHGTTNHLSGELPENLANLTSLISLDLSYNGNITGPLPARLGYLTSGVYRILFCSNQMTGTVPPEWNNLGATLKSISLFNNNLTGSIPNMTQLSHLEVLDLSYNAFTGEFPTWIKQSQETLRVLELSKNKLEGPLPPWLSSFPSLQIMNLGGNSFTGTVPSGLQTLATMTETGGNHSVLWTDQVVVTASGRSFTFDIITINTKSLDLHGNQLTGSIPSDLGALHGLYYLSLAGCNLSGSIPSRISNLSNLLTLDLSSNRLTGSIPPQLADDLVNLQFLNLSHNILSGAVPTTHQFATFNSTAFEGNPLLCGPPTHQTCNSPDSSTAASEENRWEDNIDNAGFAVGTVVGFLMVVATIGMWSPARRWVLRPLEENLWFNGHYTHPI